MIDPPNPEVVILNVALDLGEPERAAYLDEACAGNPGLRQQVEALLQAHKQAGDFLDAPAPGFDLKRTRLVNIPLTEKPGDRIGRYRLLQQIGEGGCGVVYMAEQEEPVRRRVALKVIKLGMDTRQVIARFEAERQALALMDHPNIAKVLDAGATETGRPFFVMELVRGIKITEFCDDNKASTEERLKLFIQVCQAIQHAHQKGVIHRDIKPSNILVTINDGVPVPKVIDFGIAKATQGRLTDQTLFTAFEQFIGTPAYMSPEQAVLTSLDIDTRSDIYSLGVLLYELLTGRTPFDAKELLDAGLDEMRRTIREQEPPKPSTRLGTMAADALTTTAKQRHTDAPKLIHLLRGDLDWIVMKSLDKDRARRYETANDLAMDIRRHLNCEPVIARPPSRLYEFQKTVRRHKFGFAAGAAVVTMLSLGVLVSTLEAIRATRAEKVQRQWRQQAQANEKRAESESVKSKQVAEFMKDMLKGVGPSVALGRDTTMLREVLDKTAANIDRDLKHQPEVEAELRSTLGTTYLDLGDYPRAVEMQRKALQLWKALYGESDERVAASLGDLGNALAELKEHGDLTEAECVMREALRLRRQLPGGKDAGVATSLSGLADVLLQEGKLAEAEAMEREALTIQRRLFPAGNEQMGESLNNLGAILRESNKLTEAEAVDREALELWSRLRGNESPDTTTARARLGYVLLAQRRLAEAEPLLREAYEERKRLLGGGHKYVFSTLYALFRALLLQGKLDESEKLVRDDIAIRRTTKADGTLADSLSFLSQVLREERRLSEAEATAREALAIRKELLGNEHADVAQSLHLLAWNLNLEGKHTEAEALSREELAMWRKLLGSDHPNVAWALGDLTVFLRDQGKLAEAETTIRESLAIREKRLGKTHPDTVNSFNLLADLLRTQGKEAEAKTLIEGQTNTPAEKKSEPR